MKTADGPTDSQGTDVTSWQLAVGKWQKNRNSKQNGQGKTDGSLGTSREFPAPARGLFTY